MARQDPFKSMDSYLCRPATPGWSEVSLIPAGRVRLAKSHRARRRVLQGNREGMLDGWLYRLFKSEPGAWSWTDQRPVGDNKETQWNGCAQTTLPKNMAAMRRGELGFFYHSVNERHIAGIVTVIAEGPLRFDRSARSVVLRECCCSLQHAATGYARV